MTIRYVCSKCRQKIGVSGFPAVNEVGRKFCSYCESNENDLHVVSKEECLKALREKEKNKK